MSNTRIFLLVMDSFGIGCAPDANKFGDEGSNTFQTLYNTGKLNIPNLARLGLLNIDGINLCSQSPIASYGKLVEASNAKDTVTGHWEMMGVISQTPLPVFPNGFPETFISELEKKIKRKILCNLPYSGSEVIADYGKQHLESGNVIVYTSGDSVCQIAAHIDVVPIEELYDICEQARALLTGDLSVGRVIARPFKGEYPSFQRCDELRHDYALSPPKETLLDTLRAAGKDVIGVGKIGDIFNQRGLTSSVTTGSNQLGFEKTMNLVFDNSFKDGLCFVNFVDFDSKCGHRRDVDKYVECVNVFDVFLGHLISVLKQDDILIITADHGCDPNYLGTDHTREMVPCLIYDKQPPRNIGIIKGFNFIAKYIAKKLL